MAKTKVKARRKPAQKAKRPQTTALVRRPRRTQIIPALASDLVAKASQDATIATLSDDPSVGVLGLAEVHLSAQEEVILSEPVNVAIVMVKPTGEAYVSHPDYTRWFGRAFGRTGWAIRPVGKPKQLESSIVCPYIMFIHGQPFAMAWGEQEYFANNKRQTFGEALEATRASALRRCAKQLGVGLELWDKRWLRTFETEHVIRVKVLVKDSEETWHRLKTDPPYWQEEKWNRKNRSGQPQQRQAAPPPATPAHTAPPSGTHVNYDDPITDGQRKRLFAILKNSRRDETGFRMWLKNRHGIESTSKITRRMYDGIVTAVESSGPLPMPEREPGDEG